MQDALKWFWTAMIFGSIAWYFFLLFYVGYKGGWEILRMTRALSSPREPLLKPGSGGSGGD